MKKLKTKTINKIISKVNTCKYNTYFINKK